jgi:GrpB-like predicted nucleotidyltransferase (UPF0157 family)
MTSTPIGPYPHPSPPAELRAYDPRAAEVAGRIADMVHQLLPDVDVEHVGSSSVPGCAGKGYVDLLIPFTDAAQLDCIKAALAQLGFQRQRSRDPWPEERPMRTGTLDHDGTAFLLHAHVVPADSAEPAGMRGFRDRLRADPALVAAYVAHKRAVIAAGTIDSIDYSIEKGSFVETVLRGLQSPHA